jgi:hypothetical protein
MAWCTLGLTFRVVRIDSLDSVSGVPLFEGGVQMFVIGVISELMDGCRVCVALVSASLRSVARGETSL